MTLKNKPPIVKLGVFTLITVIVWIIFDVYRALTIKPTPEVSAEILEPLSPVLDSQALNKLQNRVYLSDNEIGDTEISTPSEEVELVVPEETPIPEETPVPEATEEGTLE